MAAPKRLPHSSILALSNKTQIRDVSSKPPPLALKRTSPLPQTNPGLHNRKALSLSFLLKAPQASCLPVLSFSHASLRPVFLPASFDHGPKNICRQQATRSFTTTPPLSKKPSPGSKSKDKHHDTDTDSALSSKTAKPPSELDPFDLSTLEDAIAKALEKLRTDISKLGRGGRFDPEAIESLRVQLVKGQKETVRLSEVAQVVPKGGRSMTVLVGDEEMVKSVTSAIASSELSLNPQQDGHNPLQLNVAIPPPTKESRDKVVGMVKKAADKASMSVRDARGATHKTFKAFKGKLDEAKKAHEIMEKVARKGQDDVKSIMESAQKAMEKA